MSICYYNGQFRPVGECRLPVTDLVVQRGVGVFDSIRIYDGNPFALGEHLERLRRSAEGAGINCGGIIEHLYDVIREGAKRPDCPDGGNCIVKAYITGGDVNNCGSFPEPRYFVVYEPGPGNNEEGYKNGVVLEPTTAERQYPLVKSINYLFGIIQSAGKPDTLECLYCPKGNITETLRSSFFLYKDGKIVTAPVGRVLGGITRSIVLELARENGFTVEERCPDISELSEASEAFLTNVWNEVMPVVRVGDTVIGSGKPGPTAARLLELFRSSMHRWDDK